ncbi:MAG: hypothetical protein EXX96DRAFT_597265 [Benjaminiella poitrasii]|nr:MAG: hypothetical protein EXX96DRAFT_597265 [Benjaminiella poitrasii]
MKYIETSQNNGTRKKKAARACVHCQKAHLTCDDSRPCQRCIKRDLASTCTDGIRKKAKYLQDTDDISNSSKTDLSISGPSYTAPPLLPKNLIDTKDTSPNFLSSYRTPSQRLQFPSSKLEDNVKNYKKRSSILSAISPSSATSHNNSVGKSQKHRHIINTSACYARASKPYSYADGYHYLITYVRRKMSREELMRISKALALFRPSVLASMMNLTEDDLIFTEKCLQRTLLEYEKLITYSGTPTVVWRRTGEIVLVGKEFSLLTQWSRDVIMSKKTYIYELMSDSSAVEYWEKYALHAFDNTDSAVFSSCILLSPIKRVVPCTFCFTIKRDIFDLPSVIVGNFLPILS